MREEERERRREREREREREGCSALQDKLDEIRTLLTFIFE